jgi:hypothetical protein
MIKTIAITDPRQVRIGDKAYFKHCDFGFNVVRIRYMKSTPFAVINPLDGYEQWAESRQFKYATREVDEPEWPDPQDNELHVYLGADGKQYLYMPTYEGDSVPWKQLPYYKGDDWLNAEGMTKCYPSALPLTELKFVPANEETR